MEKSINTQAHTSAHKRTQAHTPSRSSADFWHFKRYTDGTK